ncbi:MAG: FliM/FliN family flagellar motor switch protein [Planctomycetaceae bacterium]|nr:FliM/FliN family flagellar motor switch protein [Planctomycetaceae bacterium]
MAEAAVAENVEQQNQTPQDDSKTQVQSVDFPQAVEGKVAGPGSSIDILLDMEVPVSVVLGKVEVPIQRFLQLGTGSVLKLNKSIEEPAELYLKDTKFAIGNIVVVDDQFAIRIKEVIGTVAAPQPAVKK